MVSMTMSAVGNGSVEEMAFILLLLLLSLSSFLLFLPFFLLFLLCSRLLSNASMRIEIRIFGRKNGRGSDIIL